MHRYKCLSCDIKTNKLCKDHINPKCKHKNVIEMLIITN